LRFRRLSPPRRSCRHRARFFGFLVNSIGPQAVYGLAAGLCCLGVLALMVLVRRAQAAPRVT
jgi:hypothetical protein